MKPIRELPEKDRKSIKGVMFDIDDTFTLDGQIPKEAFTALWRLHDKGFILVPITGRPAGWCDHIARMWPVDGIIGENGAFYYYYSNTEHKLIRRYIFNPAVAYEKRMQMENIRLEVLKKVPRAAVAADQPFRLFDLAIDFAEDMPRLSDKEIRDICSVFNENGAVCKVSSIHVNGWFGEYNKLTSTKLFIEERLGLSWEEARNTFVFAGDSPNDEPMFDAFPLSVGVANIERFLPVLKHMPSYVTSGEGGLGFAELADTLMNNNR